MVMVSPFDYFRPAMEAARIMAESQMVISLRLAGMAGFSPMGQAEMPRMVAEKMQAGLDMGHAAMKAGMAGDSLPDIAMAAMKPVRRRTKANARRLSRKAGGKG